MSKLCRFAIIAIAAACAAACAAAHAAKPPLLPAPRIVSLAPSLTEIVYSIGCQSELIADTLFDDFPPAAKLLPHVAALSHVDLERMALLRPTIVLALHDQEREGAQVESRLHVPVRYLPNRRLRDLFADVAAVGAACRSPAAAARLSQRLKSGIVSAAAHARRKQHRPRVLFLLGLPAFTAGRGTFIDDIIRLAGGTNVAGEIDQAYPNLSAESIVARDPDVLIVARGVPFGPDESSRAPWRDLSAVRRGKILRPPDDDVIQRNGPRIIDGLRWLAAALARAD